MGSRRRRYAALAAALVAGCTAGAPTGFSAGDRWVAPLIGPLEDGLLLVPVYVNGQGPYIFSIDPDANVTIVDEQVVKEAGMRTGEGPHLLDESDTERPRFYAEVLELEIGTLVVKNKSAEVVKSGAYDSDGRRINGVLGRDVIADSLVFAFDREKGVVTLSTTKSFTNPQASTVPYETLTSHVQNVDVVPPPRRLVKATIADQPFTLHVDFGATASQLRRRSWDKAKLAASPLETTLLDEVGTPRTIKEQGVADTIALGPVTASHVVFVAYDDRRWADQEVEGTLGLDFFRGFAVAANWDASTIHLQPRTPVAPAVRIGRWQSKTMGSCENVGCVKVSLVDPLAGKPADQVPAQHPGVVVSFAREPKAAQLQLEVLVATEPAPGKPPLKWLVANMPGNADRVMTHLPAEYVGATLTVVDASPFPRACGGDAGCVDLLAITH